MINNGVRMQDQEWGKEHAPNIDVNSIEKNNSHKKCQCFKIWW